MSKLSVGVIGVGSIGNVHLTGYAADPQHVKIQALCDVNPERLKEMANQYKVSAEHLYSSHTEMLEKEKLDTASVCTPNLYHFEHATDCLRRGLNTLVEKPMVLSLEQARELRKLSRKQNQKLMVAFSHRFITMNIAARQLMDRGAIGEPFMIRVRYAHGGPYPGWAQGDWFYKKKIAGGGALLDMGIHGIDICQYFIGPIKTIQAQVKTLRKDIEVDDNAVMLLDFAPRKCLGYVEVGWTSGPGFAGVEIYGDKGTLLLDLETPGYLIRGVKKPDGTVRTKKEPLKSKGESHWPLQMQQWIRYCLGKKTVTKIPGIEEGASSLAVALAATESSATGKRIAVKRI